MVEKRVVLVSSAVTVLGVAAAVLGFIAEATKSKAFVGFDGSRCVYRRTAALGCGVLAALLALAGLVLVSAASGCFGRYGGGSAPATGRRRSSALKLSILAWVLVVIAAVLFLYGASLNRGGTRGLTTSSRRYNRTYYYGCAMLKNGIFSTASILSFTAAMAAVVAYVNLQRADQPAAAPGQFATPGVAMGQPQWAQPYPPPAYPQQPPPVAYPDAPPPYGGYYGAKQPAGAGAS